MHWVLSPSYLPARAQAEFLNATKAPSNVVVADLTLFVILWRITTWAPVWDCWTLPSKDHILQTDSLDWLISQRDGSFEFVSAEVTTSLGPIPNVNSPWDISSSWWVRSAVKWCALSKHWSWPYKYSYRCSYCQLFDQTLENMVENTFLEDFF